MWRTRAGAAVAVTLVLLAVAGLITLISSSVGARWSAVRGALQQGGPTAFVLTQVKLIKRGDQPDFSAPAEQITTRYLDSEHYSAEAVSSGNGSSGGRRSRIVRNGPKLVTESLDTYGRVTNQSIAEYRADVPSIFEPSATANELEAILSSSHPVVDLAEIDAMIAAGDMIDQGTETLLGKTVRVVAVPSDRVPDDARGVVLGYRVWLAVPSGIKLRAEYAQRESISIRYEATTLELPASVSLAEYSTSLNVDALDRSDYSAEFSLETGAYPALAQHVIAPATQALLGGAYVLSAPVFFTRTERVQDTSTRRSGWVVTQEITGTGGKYALVAQSAGSEIPHSAFDAYWPPLWRVSDATQLSESIYASRTSQQLVGGRAADSYVLVDPDTVVSSRTPPEFKYLVTWQTDAGVRVVVVGNAAVGDEAMFGELVSAFAEAR